MCALPHNEAICFQWVLLLVICFSPLVKLMLSNRCLLVADFNTNDASLLGHKKSGLVQLHLRRII